MTQGPLGVLELDFGLELHVWDLPSGPLAVWLDEWGIIWRMGWLPQC